MLNDMPKSINPRILRAELVEFFGSFLIAKVRVAETACPPRYLCRFQPQNPGIYNIGEPLKVISQNDRIKNPLGIYSNVVQPVIMPSYELSVRIKEQVSECLPRTDHLQFHTALQKSQ
jgi:hypothetical protein